MATKKKATVKKSSTKKVATKKAGVKKVASKPKGVKKATVKKATVKKVAVKKVAVKKVAVKKVAPKQVSVKAVFPTFPEQVEPSSTEILEEIMARIHSEPISFESPIDLFAEDSPLQSPNVVTRLTGRRHLPILIICLLIAALIAGFWGKQIVESIGIPINGGNYTSIYFQDPTIVQKGLVSGDLLVFGIHNGSDKSRNLGWHVNSGPLTIARGVVKLAGNSDSYVQISTSGALSGAKIEAFVDGTSTPITVEVVG